MAVTRTLNEAAVDNTVTVVGITGAGQYFSAGNDLSAALLEEDFEAARDKSLNIVRDMVQAFVRFPKLLVAVVNGPCIGIAATIIPLCDVAYASESVSNTLVRCNTSSTHHPPSMIGLLLYSVYCVGNLR